MLNIVKADLYRLFRSKALYITLGVLLFFLILQSAMGIAGNMGVNVSIGSEMAQEELEALLEFKKLTAAQMFFFALSMAQQLIYILLPVVCVLAAIDFSTGAVKNAVCYGVSREKYMAAKLLVSSIAAVLFCLFNVIVPVLFGLIANGAGSGLDFGAFAASFFVQLIWILAFNSIAMFFTFVFRKMSATIGSYIGFLLIPSLFIMILININPSIDWLIKLDPASCVSLVASLTEHGSGTIAWLIIYPIILLAASIVGGALLFKKAEIK